MDYRKQKQIIIALASLVILLGGIFTLTFFIVGRPPTTLQETETLPPVEKPVFKNLEVVFADFFEIRKHDTHDAVAFVKNPNLEHGASQILYEFIFTDTQGTELLRVQGKTFVLPGESRYVIEPAIKVPGKPAEVTFRVLAAVWQGLEPFSPVGLDVEDTNLHRDEDAGTTRFSGVVRNGTPYNLKDVEAHVVLYDPARGDAPVAAGKTNMQLLLRDGVRAFQIAWPYILPPGLEIDVRAESDFFENSNFIREYGRTDTFREYY